MSKLLVILTVGVLVMGAPAAVGNQWLSAEGVDLGRVKVESVKNGLSVSVDAVELDVISTYAVARFQSNAPRQRTANGFWVPWNGRIKSLIDLELVPSPDGSLTFPLVDEDLSAQFLPITFTVIVRTAGDLRWGYVVVER